MSDGGTASISQFALIKEKLSAGQSVEPESVRIVLSWFGAQRRGYWIVREVREALKEYGLTTIPDLEATHIDGKLHFELLKMTGTTEGDSSLEITTVEEVAGPHEDPTFRLARLAAANRSPVTVLPEDPIGRAITMMIHHDFSQLPVMQGERTVKGVISWASVGKRLALCAAGSVVQDFMESAHIADSDASLFSTLERIVQNDYVLVRHPDGRIGGIITTADLSEEFRQLAEPYLLLGEIENHLRHVIGNRFTADELKTFRDPNDKDRQVSDVSDLTFGEYIRLMEEDARWQRLDLRLDRQECLTYMKEIKEIRNDVMHFDPDPLGNDRIDRLRNFARVMQTLREVGVV